MHLVRRRGPALESSRGSHGRTARVRQSLLFLSLSLHTSASAAPMTGTSWYWLPSISVGYQLLHPQVYRTVGRLRTFSTACLGLPSSLVLTSHQRQMDLDGHQHRPAHGPTPYRHTTGGAHATSLPSKTAEPALA